MKFDRLKNENAFWMSILDFAYSYSDLILDPTI